MLKQKTNILDYAKVYLEIWKEGGTSYDVAKRFEISVGNVNARRYQLSKRGVNLPPLRNARITYTQETIDQIKGMVERALAELKR